MLNAYAQELSNELSTFVEDRVRRMMTHVVVDTELKQSYDIALDGLLRNPDCDRALKALNRVWDMAAAKADILLS